ncbi:MAG: thiamine diphosphokinase [Clostridiales bacterium]|nr:thiamine diphosphokinase [Clostridiales bacterium]
MDTNNIKIPEGSFIIAADGGYSCLRELKIKPDLTVGDFDSLGYVPDEKNVVRHSPIKDETDTVLAVDEGLSRGYKTFYIYGGMGGRLDHTLANIQTLSYLAEKGACGFLFGDDFVMTVLKSGRLKFDKSFSGVVSVFCLGDRAKDVTIKGLKYNVESAEMTCSYPLGVSNEFIGEAAAIGVGEGMLAVMWQRQKSADLPVKG